MSLSGNSIDISLIKNEISFPFKVFSRSTKCSKITSLLRKLVCEHQGTIIEHIYWATEIHKDLRRACDEKNKTVIKRKLAEIDNDLPALFQSAWRMTVSVLSTYFSISHKSPTLPRMCIKATSTKEKEKYIVDVFREDGGTSKLTYKVSENTGFQSVEDDGRYYICNNIPIASSSSNYINPRLNKELAKRYKQNWWEKQKSRSTKQYFDKSWADCWFDYSKEKGNGASCYKSTLIVPMTLINNHQSSRFVKNTMVGISKNERAIYGCLCFDHTETGYFNDDDINTGYIVADLLSFYMINELNFTTYSSTYERAKKEA